jgi:hypothetical protein
VLGSAGQSGRRPGRRSSAGGSAGWSRCLGTDQQVGVPVAALLVAAGTVADHGREIAVFEGIGHRAPPVRRCGGASPFFPYRWPRPPACPPEARTSAVTATTGTSWGGSRLVVLWSAASGSPDSCRAAHLRPRRGATSSLRHSDRLTTSGGATATSRKAIRHDSFNAGRLGGRGRLPAMWCTPREPRTPLLGHEPALSPEQPTGPCRAVAALSPFRVHGNLPGQCLACRPHRPGNRSRRTQVFLPKGRLRSQKEAR